MLYVLQAGYETLAVRELEAAGAAVAEQGPGWVRTAEGPPAASDLAFPHLALVDPREVRAGSVNALARALEEWFSRALGGERVAGPWPRIFAGPAEPAGLGRWISAVGEAWDARLGKRLPRVAKLAVPDLPRGIGLTRGMFGWFPGFDRAWAAREAWRNGQRRMADDAQAPSRSYLKVEEAYAVLGRAPQSGESVVDLGAAPGGWSYSAAARGARVVAVDNGPLKAGALGHRSIEHRREDAFGYVPPAPVDWLFCDLVEEPRRVLEGIVRPWLGRSLCRHWIVNLKFGRTDPVALLRDLRAGDSPLAAASRIRHLYHDREEFTVVGPVRE